MDTNFFAGSAIPLLIVAATVPAAKVIHAGDAPASTIPTTVAVADSGAPLV